LLALGFFAPLMIVLGKPPIVPDLIIAENGKSIALQNDAGQLVSARPRSSKFVQEIWGKAWASGELESAKLPKDVCDRDRCVFRLLSGQVVHIVYDPKLIQASCEVADLLIAPRLWWVNCKVRVPELILKRHDFEQYGTHAIFLGKMKDSNDNFRIERALPEPKRPWHRVVAEKK